jgi:hypothetical protein
LHQLTQAYDLNELYFNEEGLGLGDLLDSEADYESMGRSKSFGDYRQMSRQKKVQRHNLVGHGVASESNPYMATEVAPRALPSGGKSGRSSQNLLAKSHQVASYDARSLQA